MNVISTSGSVHKIASTLWDHTTVPVKLDTSSMSTTEPATVRQPMCNHPSQTIFQIKHLPIIIMICIVTILCEQLIMKCLDQYENSILDIDECGRNNGGCHGTCLNIDGSFRCGCEVGYELELDGISCRGNTTSGNCTELIK